MKICGPKCSLCGLIISVWGIIQLVLMGIFYQIHAVALVEDLDLKDSYKTADDFYSDVDKRYKQSALNCWIAACIYCVTFVLSAHQFWVNSRSSSRM